MAQDLYLANSTKPVQNGSLVVGLPGTRENMEINQVDDLMIQIMWLVKK